MFTAQQHIFHYKSFRIDKSQPLGHGSYGAVYKAKCDQLPCAAKILHPTIFDPRDPGADKIMERFSQECAILESIRHPNIVQYLAVTLDPESRLPVLLMELLDHSLTKMLERSQQSLAYYVQVDICHDIALAVAYLHSNSIIHRDLSSNNVLIIAEKRAKVTDFGMSKLAGAAPTMTPLTMCPGTLAYMAPEALREPPRYTKKLDCFSEGVIMIQVCTRLWPEPGPRSQIIQDSRSPTGIMEMPIPEMERRKKHIDLIDPTHPLLPIAVDCLHFKEMNRPSSEELCETLCHIKESTNYMKSIERQQVESAKVDQICLLTQQLQKSDAVLCEKNEDLRLKDEQLQNKDIEMDRLLQQKERQDRNSRRQIQQLNTQLKEQEQITAEIQKTNHSLQRQVEQLSEQTHVHGLPQVSPPPPCLQLERNVLQQKPSFKRSFSEQLPKQAHQQLPAPKEWKITLSRRDGSKAPFGICRGAAVVDGNIAYFMGWCGEACSYNSISRKWRKLPKYPYEYSSLAVVKGQLTAIGGCEYSGKDTCYTNRLLSLNSSQSLKSWSAIFPSMPTKRRGTTAITSKEHLIVAGGTTGPGGTDNINTVEVMDTKTLVWSTVASLPHPYYLASATVCGDHLYLLGGLDNKGKTKSVLTCSLTELLQSSSSSSVWHRVADAPAYYSTCATVNEQLLAVGGCDENRTPSTAIHKYNPTSNSWDHRSNMPTARYLCLVAVLPTNEMMAVGGYISRVKKTETVEMITPS